MVCCVLRCGRSAVTARRALCTVEARVADDVMYVKSRALVSALATSPIDVATFLTRGGRVGPVGCRPIEVLGPGGGHNHANTKNTQRN